MSRSFVPPVWCSCGTDGEHLSSFGPECASTARTSAVAQPLVVSPVAPHAAAAPRTGRTQRSFAIVTPLGRTSRFSLPY